jgi:hypothetical protein
MKNIFKTFKENKRLEEENRLLKAQNEALIEFRKSFDDYYNNISGVKVITRNYDKQVVIKASYRLDRDSMYCPVDVCKEDIARKMSRELLPLIEFDIIDNNAYGTKDIVGRLIVLTR